MLLAATLQHPSSLHSHVQAEACRLSPTILQPSWLVPGPPVFGPVFLRLSC